MDSETAMHGERSNAELVLVSMPWADLELPSIQLGILQNVARRAGAHAEVRHFYLRFADYLCAATGGALQVDDYRSVAHESWRIGLGDWIFAVPPYRSSEPQLDRQYLDYARRAHLSEAHLQAALAMRRVVPAFVEACARDVLLSHPQVVGFTSSFSQNVPSLVVASLIKTLAPNTKIVFGGANCDGPMGAALCRLFPLSTPSCRAKGSRYSSHCCGLWPFQTTSVHLFRAFCGRGKRVIRRQRSPWR